MKVLGDTSEAVQSGCEKASFIFMRKESYLKIFLKCLSFRFNAAVSAPGNILNKGLSAAGNHIAAKENLSLM